MRRQRKVLEAAWLGAPHMDCPSDPMSGVSFFRRVIPSAAGTSTLSMTMMDADDDHHHQEEGMRGRGGEQEMQGRTMEEREGVQEEDHMGGGSVGGEHMDTTKEERASMC